MKKHRWMFISAVVAAAVPWAACGGSSGTGTTTTAGSGAHATTGSASHAASSGVTTGSSAGGAGGGSVGTGGANACMGILTPGDPCDDCITTSCCGELAKCNEDSAGNCVNCATSQDMSTDCTMAPTVGLVSALNACLASKCGTQCPPPPSPACDAPATAPSGGSCYTYTADGGCNPITNAGCTAAGAACDEDMTTEFSCYTMPANTAALCGMCDLGNGPACQPGSTCIATSAGPGICAKYCCADGDCGSGTCNKNMTTNDPAVGICLAKGAADAGTD